MSAQRYPLSWPSGWPRTSAADRAAAPFGKSSAERVTEREYRGSDSRGNAVYVDVERTKHRSRLLTSADASARLQRQLELLGAVDALLSTNQRLRLDGVPVSNQIDPADCGAAVYFKLNGQDRVLACDKWNRLADNIAALAAHIDAIRRIDRYGVGSLDQAFAGYVGLPAKGQTWKTTLGFAPDADVTWPMVETAFKQRAREVHPDAEKGSHDAMASLSEAKAEARQALGLTSKPYAASAER